jgi:UPF0176 protein
VGHGLVEGEASLCRACRHPLTPADRASPDHVEGVSCPYCVGEATKHAAAAERHKQMELARQRGAAHMGEGASTLAARNKARKLAQRQADRDRAKES